MSALKEMIESGKCSVCKNDVRIFIKPPIPHSAAEVYCSHCDKSTRIPEEVVGSVKQMLGMGLGVQRPQLPPGVRQQPLSPQIRG